MTDKLNIVIEATGRDAASCERIEKHLIGQWASARPSIWYRSKMRVGLVIVPTLVQHFNEADLILLLMSADFVADWNDEFSASFERLGHVRHKIVPVIVSPCTWRHLPLSELPCVPADETLSDSGRSDETLFFRIAKEIRHRMDTLHTAPLLSLGGDGPSVESGTSSHNRIKTEVDLSFFELLARRYDHLPREKDSLSSVKITELKDALTEALERIESSKKQESNEGAIHRTKSSRSLGSPWLENRGVNFAFGMLLGIAFGIVLGATFF